MTHPQPNPPEKVESLVERLRLVADDMCELPAYALAAEEGVARILALEAQVAGMGEALEPFAEIAGRYKTGGLQADIDSRASYLTKLLKAADFHAAAKALAAAKEPS